MSYCDACNKRFTPPIIYDCNGKFSGFDYLCCECKSLGQMVSTEEAIRRHDWHRITTLEEVRNPVENLLVSNPIVDNNQ
jgi:hypothetical protein